MPTRWWALAALVAPLAPLASPQLANAQSRGRDRVEACIGEHVEAQLLRKRGRLVDAHARLLECSQPTCPELVREECSVLSRLVEAAMPSVVLGAVGADGRPTAEPLVSIDGSPELVPLDGQPLALDPGEHRLRFQHPDGAVRRMKLVLRESEHELAVVADFRATDAATSNSLGARRQANGVMLVSAGFAAAALGSFTYFALAGRAVQADLDRCKPTCDNRSDVDRMRSRYLIADISLGVALVSLGVGAYAWAERPSAEQVKTSSSSSPRAGVRLQPVASPRTLGLWASGEF